LNDKIAAEREELAAAATNSLSTYSAGPGVPLATYEEARSGRSKQIVQSLKPRFLSVN